MAWLTSRGGRGAEQANPDEEGLVSWEASKDACIAELDRLLREPQDAGGEKT